MDFTIFQNNLKRLMDARGLNITELAAQLGIDKGTISRYTSKNRIPRVEYLIAIARFFDVSLDWLLFSTSNISHDIRPEDQLILSLYSAASPSDRQVVNAILQRYKE